MTGKIKIPDNWTMWKPYRIFDYDLMPPEYIWENLEDRINDWLYDTHDRSIYDIWYAVKDRLTELEK